MFSRELLNNKPAFHERNARRYNAMLTFTTYTVFNVKISCCSIINKKKNKQKNFFSKHERIKHDFLYAKNRVLQCKK